MLGVLLTGIATFFSEIGDSIGKREVGRRAVSLYTFGFLNVLWGAIIYFSIAFFIRHEFIFSMASLPTFVPRFVLEVLQAHITILAVTRADRSTFSFIRVLTIPLLLLADIVLGYTLTGTQVIGLALIIISFLTLFFGRGIGRTGALITALTAVNAVITISLYKYNITHFNSVEAEQGIIALGVTVYFFIMAFFRAQENPFRFLARPVFLVQTLSSGVASAILGFAYNFGVASVITTAKRACTILWSLLSGQYYFNEGRLLPKVIAFVAVIAGLALLAF